MSQRIAVNGVSLVYDDSGSGIPFVTLHGGPGMSSRRGDWRAFQPLTDEYRLISYDQRGNGESDAGEPYSHEQFVADLEVIRQKLGLGKIVLLGGSYGGFLALEYALRHQDNLLALVLRDTAASNRFQDTSIRQAMQSGLPMDPERLERLFAGRVESNQDFRDSFGMIMPLYDANYDPSRSFWQLDQVPFRYETHNWAFSRNQPAYDLTARLNEIRTPTLVTVGRHDWITPVEASEEIHAGIPGSELVIFENSGHGPHNEENARYIAAVRDFLARRATTAA